MGKTHQHTTSRIEGNPNSHQDGIDSGSKIGDLGLEIHRVGAESTAAAFNSGSPLCGADLVVEVADGVEAQREVHLVLPPPRRRRLPRRRRRCGRGSDRGEGEGRERRGRGRGRRRRRGGLPEEGAEVEGVEATEATEGKHDGAELLRGAAQVGPVPGADPLPEPLVLRRPPPEPAHARRPRQRRRVRVPQHLDNKPPRGPPYEAAVALRRLASLFGRVVGVSAYANRHAFLHLPRWVLEERRERRRQDDLERRGLAIPADPYTCSVCGRRCSTHANLRKHFLQLHERERQKKLARLQSLKGKKRRRYKERHISGNTKYEEAARELLKPKVGYGLAAELRRAGVSVKTVADKSQAADAALKRQVQHSMASGIDWLLLVSDDSDFSEMLRRAREAELRTVVVGDVQTALGRQADLWLPWTGVERGQVGEEVLLWGRRLDDRDEVGVSFSGDSNSDGESDWSELDSMVDEIVVGSSGFRGPGVSAFSEEELVAFEGADDREGLGDNDFRVSGLALPGEDLFWDSEDEDDG